MEERDERVSLTKRRRVPSVWTKLKEVFDILEEVDDPDDCEIIRVKAGAIHLKLTDDGEFLFESGSEQFADDLARVYPLLEKGRADQLSKGLFLTRRNGRNSFAKP